MQDSIRHTQTTEFTDTIAAVADTGHVYKWQWETLQQVPGMYQRDSIPELKLNGFHRQKILDGCLDSYVSQTQFFHKELPAVRNGEIGIPVENSVSNDSLLTLTIFMCVLLSIITLSRSWHFTCYQFKNIFRTPRETSTLLRETSSEMRYQTYFSFQGVLLLAFFLYDVTRMTLSSGEDLSVSSYTMIAIYGVLILLYRGLCELVESIVLPVYFNKNQRMIWAGNRLFLISIQGALLLPLALVYFFFRLNPDTSLLIAAGIIITTMLLRFYKAYCSFFQKNGAFLQFFLYLCTLKVVPLALTATIALFIANYLKINI